MTVRAHTGRFFFQLANTIIQFRLPLLIAVTVLSAVFAWAASKIVVNNSNDAFFVKNDPQLKGYREFQTTFGSEEFLMIYVENGEIFSLSTYHKLHRLIESMRKLNYDGKPMFSQILSPYDAQIIRGDHESISVVPSLQNQKTPTQNDLDATKQLMVTHPVYRNLLVNENGSAGAIVGIMHPNMDEKYTIKSSKSVAALIASSPYNTIDARLVGGPALKMHLDESTAKEAAFFGACAIAVCILVMLLMFRRLEQVFSTVLVLILAVAWTLGFMSLLHVQMTLVTIILPLVIIITGLGSCVHIISAFRRRIARGMAPRDAMARAFGETGEACLYTSMTSAVGFLSMISAPVNPMRSMGIFAALGIMVTYALTFILLPSLLGKSTNAKEVSPPPVLSTLVRDKFFGALAAVSLKKPWVTTIVCAIVTLTMASGIFFVKVESNFVQALNPKHPQRVAIEHVDQRLGGTSTLEVILDSGKPNGAFDPELLEVISQLTAWIKQTQYDVVTTVISPVLILAEANRAFKNTTELPKTKEAAAQLMFLYEISGGDVRMVMSPDGQKARISIRTRTMSTSRDLKLESDIVDKIKTLWPRASEPNGSNAVKLTGMNSLFVHLSEYVVTSQLNSFASAGLIIALLMMWLLRSWRLGLMTMLPNALPILATYGMMGWLGVPIDWLSAVIPGVALGVAVDDTIHIASQFEKSRAKGKTPYEAAHHVIQTIGRAITVSTLALCGGFCVFVFSILDSLARVGLLLAFALLLALVLNLIMTPAILALVKTKTSA